MTGKTVSGYTIKKLIGTGGMAEVYYAENGLGKAAAIKVLLKKYSEDTAVRERFELEARVMVKLDHPHIRKVFDIGELDQRPAIIMEYLEGNTLKEALDSKSKPTDDKLRRYFDQCCEALAYTHSKGIVHRDIKPSNIFITRQDEIKILDFGIAKTRESVSNTLTGQTLGTILYMSPEQVKDPKRVDEKTDVYSLGVSFYHAVTGRAPYETSTDSSFEIQSKIVNDSLDFTILPPHWQLKLRPYLEKEKWQRPDLSIFRKT